MPSDRRRRDRHSVGAPSCGHIGTLGNPRRGLALMLALNAFTLWGVSDLLSEQSAWPWGAADMRLFCLPANVLTFLAYGLLSLRLPGFRRPSRRGLPAAFSRRAGWRSSSPACWDTPGLPLFQLAGTLLGSGGALAFVCWEFSFAALGNANSEIARPVRKHAHGGTLPSACAGPQQPHRLPAGPGPHPRLHRPSPRRAIMRPDRHPRNHGHRRMRRPRRRRARVRRCPAPNTLEGRVAELVDAPRLRHDDRGHRPRHGRLREPGVDQRRGPHAHVPGGWRRVRRHPRPALVQVQGVPQHHGRVPCAHAHHRVGAVPVPFWTSAYQGFFLAFGCLIFSLASVLMMMACIEISHEHKAPLGVIYGLFAAGTYLAQVLGGSLAGIVSSSEFPQQFQVIAIVALLLWGDIGHRLHRHEEKGCPGPGLRRHLRWRGRRRQHG